MIDGQQGVSNVGVTQGQNNQMGHNSTHNNSTLDKPFVPQDKPVEKEDLSFGTLAVKLGFITRERIRECLLIQEKIHSFGVRSPKIGEIMIDKGYLTEEQVGKIFRTQGLKGGHNQIAGYKILGLIGQGAMGKVYRATQISMDRTVAIKILAPHLAQDDKFVERFFKEARFVAKLNHPNIIQGIDVGESNGVHYFTMEYIDGPTIESLVKLRGAMQEKKAIKIIMQVAQALQHAYENSMVHRDIKPRNIMVNQNDIVKLCDLGLAQLVIPESGSATGKRIRMGTPAYISPEQGRGDPDVDIRSDIYSLGVTFYYMVVGDAPFHGDSTTEVINKHIAEEPPAPRERNPAISNFTNTIILKMMSKKREARYQTPTELMQDLEAVLAGRPLAIATMQPSKLRFAPRLSRATALARLKHKGINRLHLRRPLK